MPSNLYINALQSDDLGYLIAIFAVPSFISFVVATTILYRAKFHWSLIPLLLTRRLQEQEDDEEPEELELKLLNTHTATTTDNSSDVSFDRKVTCLYFGIGILVVLPIALLGVFTAAVCIYVDIILGITIGALCFMMITCTWSICSWKLHSWQLIAPVRLGLMVTCTVAVGLLIVQIYFADPNEFVGFSIFFLMANLVPFTELLFRLRTRKPPKFGEYSDMAVPLVYSLPPLNIAAESNQANSPGPVALNTTINVIPTAEPIRSSQWELTPGIAIILYIVSLLVLIAYSVLTAIIGLNYLGVIISAAVVYLDILVIMNLYGDEQRSPLAATLLSGGSRILLTIGGSDLFMIGHSILFIILSFYFGYHILNLCWPATYSRQAKSFPESDTADDEEESEVDENAVSGSGSQLSSASANNSSQNGNTQFSASLFTQMHSLRSPHTASLAWWLLWMGFAADVIFSYLTQDAGDIYFGQETQMNYFMIGVAAMVLVVIIALAALMFRLFHNSFYCVTSSVAKLAIVWYGIFLGIGAIFAWRADDYLIPLSCAFLPPLIISLTVIFANWVSNGFHIFLPSQFRNPPYCSVWHAMWNRGLPSSDFYMFGGMTFILMLLIGFSIALSYILEPNWAGYVVAFVIFIVLTTITPIIEWFHTLRWSSHMLTQSLMTICTVSIASLLIFLYPLDATVDESAFLLLLLTFLYIFLIFTVCGMYKWYDDDWQMSTFVVWSLFTTLLLTSLFFFFVAVLFDPWYYGAVGFAIFSSLLIIIGVMTKIKTEYNHLYNLTWAIIILVFSIVIVIVGYSSSSGFLAFSLLITVLDLICIGHAYTLHRAASLESGSIHAQFTTIYSSKVFPIYVYFSRTSESSENPLVINNSRVVSIFSVVTFLYIWGTIAPFFMNLSSAGISFSSTSIYTCYLICRELIHRSKLNSLQLDNAVNHLGEGSEEYRSALLQAKWTAARHQLLRESSVISSIPRYPISQQKLLNADTSSVGARAKEKLLLQLVYNRIRAELKTIENQQDYTAEFNLFVNLGKLLTRSRLRGCFSQIHVPFENELLSHRNAILKLETLYTSYASFLSRASLYNVHLQQELIKIVEVMKHAVVVNIVNMLRQEGDFSITIAEVKSLPPWDERLRKWQTKLPFWQFRRGQLLEAKRIQRAESEAGHVKRLGGHSLSLKDTIRAQNQSLNPGLREKDQKEEEANNSPQTLQRHHRDDRGIDLKKEKNGRLKQLRLKTEQIELEIKNIEYEFMHKLQDLNTAYIEVQRQRRILKKRKEQRMSSTLPNTVINTCGKDPTLSSTMSVSKPVMLTAAQESTSIARLKTQKRELREKIESTEQERTAKISELHQRKKKLQQRLNNFDSLWEQNTSKHEMRFSQIPSGPVATKEEKSVTTVVTNDQGMVIRHSETELNNKRILTNNEDKAALLLSQCKKSLTRWIDPDFPPDSRSLFIDPSNPHNPDWINAEWRRVSELTKRPLLLHPPMEANDIRQGRIGNCWLLSALAALTLKPAAVFACFTITEYNDQGIYGVRFFRHGHTEYVLVDDYIPVIKQVNDQWEPLFAHSPNNEELWALLIEKAYAKMCGSYAAMEGGWVDSALMELTGGSGDRLCFSDENVRAQLTDGSIWRMMKKCYENGFLMGAGSPVGESDSEEHASQQGIVQSHAYSILRVVEVDGIHLVQLRNPWGRKEWSGDWSDDSPCWTQRLASKVGLVRSDDGNFWMSFEDFIVHFDELYICRFFENDLWPCRGFIDGEWKGITAGGCCLHDTVENNTQYAVSAISSKPVEIFVELIQKCDRNEAATNGYPLIILELYDNKGKRVTRHSRGSLMANNGGTTEYIHFECTLPGGGMDSTPFTLLVCTYEPNVESSYMLRWFAKGEVRMQRFAFANDAFAVSCTSQFADVASNHRLIARDVDEHLLMESVEVPEARIKEKLEEKISDPLELTGEEFGLGLDLEAAQQEAPIRRRKLKPRKYRITPISSEIFEV